MPVCRLLNVTFLYLEINNGVCSSDSTRINRLFPKKGQKDMTILSIPEAFLVYTACKDAAEFAKGIIHISFAFDCLPVLFQQKYCSVNGSIVFRHPASLRTAVMFMVAEKILLESGKMYCINNQDPQHRVARRRRGL